MSMIKIAGSFLVGLAAGAAIGILMAPAKGSETRRKIAEKGEDLVDALKTKFCGVMNTISDKYDKVKESLQDS